MDTINRMGSTWQSGTLANSTPLPIQLAPIKTTSQQAAPFQGAPLPCTIVLNTTYASKLIQISVNDDASLPFTPAYATSNANQLVVYLTSSAKWVLFTGQASDTWSIT